MFNCKALLKRLTLKRLLELNRKESGTTAEELLKDRKAYGKPRELL